MYINLWLHTLIAVMSPASTNTSDLVNILFCAGIVLWIVVGAAVLRYRRKHRKLEMAGTSVLLNYYTDGVNLMPLKTGMIGDMHFSTIATLPEHGLVAGEAALIYQVGLPYKTKIHIVGIPKNTGNAQLNPSGGKSLMEPVALEGDYGDYFTLYAEKGMQEESRYVLDPKAMVFTVDFCQSHNWEIVDNELFFVQATANASGDPTNMADDIIKFVHEIQPAIALPLSEYDIAKRTPYNQEYRTDLKCPICQLTLVKKGNFLACPSCHGILLKGAALSELNSGKLELPENSTLTKSTTHGVLSCPSCGQVMEQIMYDGGLTAIDTCSHCPYRWLDNNEARRISDSSTHKT